MSISYKNIRKKTPIKMERLGTAILMLTSGMTPIVASLPINNNIAIWINAGLSTLGLGAKIFTMMLSEDEPLNSSTNE